MKITRFSSYSGKENRAFVRVAAELEVNVVASDGNGAKRSFDGLTCNVSAGGLCVEIPQLDTAYWKRIREPNPPVEMTISFPHHSQPVNARGEVRWVSVKKGRKASMVLGVQFSSLDAAGKSMIVELIEKKYLLDYRALTSRESK